MDEQRFDGLLGKLAQRRVDTSRLERGFETRVMARLRAEQEEQSSALFLAWRLAPAFIALFIFVTALAQVFGTDMEIDHIAASPARQDGIQLVRYMGND
ncbi:MAG: hypothetical protein HZA04_07900 [Nitrospinae bacterium]|nr:hypothetical protein [Nitrospinota bacterium]